MMLGTLVNILRLLPRTPEEQQALSLGSYVILFGFAIDFGYRVLEFWVDQNPDHIFS